MGRAAKITVVHHYHHKDGTFASAPTDLGPAPASPLLKPTAWPSEDASTRPKAPRPPLVTTEKVRRWSALAREHAIVAKTTALNAYRALPEWAQPITWGLAAATPVSFVMLTIFLCR